MSDLVFDARILLPIGPPYCGKHLLGEHLHDVGIVSSILDEFAVLDDPHHGVLSAADESAILQRCESIDLEHMTDERTLVLYSFMSTQGLDRLLDFASRWEDDLCLIMMDTGADVALERHRRDRRYEIDEDRLVALYGALESISPPSIGYPFETASTLAIATEGQDDW